MTFRACKYGCNTLIQWDTKLGRFLENDGQIHDRVRCESLRPIGAVGTEPAKVQQPQAQPQQRTAQVTQQPAAQQAEGPSRYESSYLIPKEEWTKLLDGIIRITGQIERLSEFYDGMMQDIESIRTVVLDQRNQKLAERSRKYEQELAKEEAAYDQDKEDGTEGFA